MTTFDELVHGLFADLFRVSPVFATSLGHHEHDGEWPDLSEVGARALVALLDRWIEAFAALPPDMLTPDEAVDREIVLAELAAMRFAETELRAEAWDPLAWIYLLGDGIHLLLAREFAPLGERLASAAARIEGIPAVLAAARRRLVGVPGQRVGVPGQQVGVPGRPVSRLHAEVALAQLPGIAELCREALGAAATADEEGELAPVRARLEPAVAAAEAALDGFAAHLRDVGDPARRGRRPAGTRPLRRQAPPHPAGRDDARRPRGARPPRVRRRPRRDGPPRRRALADAPSRRAPAPDEGRPGPGCPRRDRRRPPPPGRAARLLPGGAGSGRVLLQRAERGGPARRAAGDRVDAALPARVRGGDAQLAGPARPRPPQLLLRHPDARGLDSRAGGVVPARGQRPDAGDLLTIHEAVPGHYLQLATRTAARRSSGRRSAPASSPRGGRST